MLRTVAGPVHGHSDVGRAHESHTIASERATAAGRKSTLEPNLGPGKARRGPGVAHMQRGEVAQEVAPGHPKQPLLSIRCVAAVPV
mmetsp:Transcript_10943/g.12405  ORF Transcript_10943/g.12405 Transcript_10943/m.12405 type:complete len:86 (-) Transcript_10943:205-462(-)